MTTFDMMAMARMNNKTYRVKDMLYNNKLGFHEESGLPWRAHTFNFLNDLFVLNNDWEEDTTIYMTKSEAEAKYGIKIIE